MSESWTYKLKNAGNGFIIRDEDDYNICDVFMTNDPKIAESRARLMSCAPLLLEALNALLCDGSQAYQVRVKAQARAVIAKAEGRL